MNTHDHDEPADDLVQYALGQLDEEAMRAIDRRVAAEPAFAAEVDAVRRVLDLLPASVATPPPPALRERVLAAAAAAEAVPAPRREVVAAGPRSFRLPRLVWAPALAMAAALAVWFGVDNARLRTELSQATVGVDRGAALEREARVLLQEPNVVVGFAMTGEPGAPSARGSVLLDLDAKRGAVVLRDLPAPAAGQVYRLWAEVDAQPVYCGDLAFDAGSVRAQLSIPVESYTSPVSRLFVTLESEGAPLVPAGPTLVSGVPAADGA